MTSNEELRKYDIVLIGATGYTGQLTAEHITRYLPSDLRWAIAGRSTAKLEALTEKLKALRPDRPQPAIETVSLDQPEQVYAAVQAARVCISVVSYSHVGEVVVEACVANGTDYVDTLGDIYLVRTFIEKYHEKAKAAGVALIHACGFVSGTQDILIWVAVRKLREASHPKTKELILSIKEANVQVSGGSLDTIFINAARDHLRVEEAEQPWALSPHQGVSPSASTSRLGMRQQSELGLLSASSLAAIPNRAIVHRTWGLLHDTDDAYGPGFQYNEYDKVSSTMDGILRILSAVLLTTVLGFSVARHLLQKFASAPGEGPDVEETRNSPVVLEAVAVADRGIDDGQQAPRAFSSFEFSSGTYHITALFLSQAAASLLYSRRLEGGFSGGCLTPAMLGADLVERLQMAGAKIGTRLAS